MKISKAVSSIFYRSKLLMPIYSLFIAASLFFGIKQISQIDSMLLFDKNILWLSMFSFVVFAFLAYEFFRRSKSCSLEECLKVTNDGNLQIIKAQLRFMTALVSAFFALMFIFYLVNFIAYYINYGAGRELSFKFLCEIALGLVLNYFIIPFTGVCFGMFFSLYSNRIVSYLFLVFVVLAGTLMMDNLEALIYESSGINLYPIFKIFNFYTPDLQWRPLYPFGNSILPYRWLMPIFWCLLLTALSAIKASVLLNKGKLIKTGVSLLLAFTCLAAGLPPCSMIGRDSLNPTEGVLADEEYYFTLHTEEEDRYKKADFSISEYDIKLSAVLKLKASVTMHIEENDLSEYCFTLYHGYKLSDVTDSSGKALDYVQENDYITVYGNGLNQICMHYSGFSATFYSNVQGIFLPSYFPYLPHSGWNAVYNRDFLGVNRFYFDDDTVIKLQIENLQRVYSNIDEVEKNSFSGAGSGITLLSGLYDEITVENIRVIYPFLDPTEDKLEQNVKECIGTECLSDNIKTIMILPDMNTHSPYNLYADYGDHIVVCQSNSIDSHYKKQTISSEKYDLNSMYYSYLSGKEDFIYLANETALPPFVLFLEYLDANGEAEGLNQIYDYLNDDNDKRNWQEFLEE